jgi:hypothetical protein
VDADAVALSVVAAEEESVAPQVGALRDGLPAHVVVLLGVEPLARSGPSGVCKGPAALPSCEPG